MSRCALAPSVHAQQQKQQLHFLVFVWLRLDLEYPDELWKCLSCFDTCFCLRCHHSVSSNNKDEVFHIYFINEQTSV